MNYSRTVVQGGSVLLPIGVRCSSYCLDMDNNTIFSPLHDVIFKSNRICNSLLFSFRTMLRAVESSATQSLRLILTRQLAEVLLRGVSGAVYSCPERVIETTGQFQYLC